MDLKKITYLQSNTGVNMVSDILLGYIVGLAPTFFIYVI